MEEYLGRFSSLYDRVQVSDSYGIELFLAGLKKDISHFVLLLKPNSYMEAVHQALSAEIALPLFQGQSPNTQTTDPAQNRATRLHYYPPRQHNTNPNPTRLQNQPIQNKQPTTQNTTIQSLDEKTKQERKEKGLCIFCAEKFYRGHKCATKLFFLCSNEEEQDPAFYGISEEELPDPPPDTEEAPLISFMALHDISTGHPTAMRVLIYINKQNLYTLIDTGSTHNLISQEKAEVMGLPLTQINPIRITVANGEHIIATQACVDIQWIIQRAEFTITALVIPLTHYDFILGLAWLRSIGIITWNFQLMHMRFLNQGQVITIKGDSKISAKVIAPPPLWIDYSADLQMSLLLICAS